VDDFPIPNEESLLANMLNNTPLGLSEHAEDWSKLFDVTKEPRDTDLIKRLERNKSEQRRAKKISDQIDEIHTILKNSSFPLVSNSKYHILHGCEQYIKNLEEALSKLPSDPPSSVSSRKKNINETDISSDFKTDYYNSFENSLLIVQ